MQRYAKGDKISVKANSPMYNSLEDCKSGSNATTKAESNSNYTVLQNGIRIKGTSSDPIYAYQIECYVPIKDNSGKIIQNKKLALWVDGSVCSGSAPITNINGGPISQIKVSASATQYGSFSSENINIGDAAKLSPLVNDPYGKNSVYTLSDKARKDFVTNSEIKQSIFNMGIIDREDRDIKDSSKDLLLYNKFDRNGCVDPYNGFVGSKEYVFFTRPDLHLFEDDSFSSSLNPELVKLPLFEDYFERYPHIFKMLQSSSEPKGATGNSPFITILTNTIASPIQLPDLQAKLLETGANAYGTKISYRGTSHPSDEDISFSTDFIDNRYLEVFTLFKLYDEYEKQKNLGYITPRTPLYIVNKILYDQISIFKIVVAEDGESLLYFAKWTGCVPINVPTDSLSDMSSISGNLNISINWHAAFFEDMDKEILQDFNAVVLNHIGETRVKADTGNDIKLFDPTTNMSNGAWATYPYIASINMDDDNGLELTRLKKMRRYKLKWR